MPLALLRLPSERKRNRLSASQRTERLAVTLSAAAPTVYEPRLTVLSGSVWRASSVVEVSTGDGVAESRLRRLRGLSRVHRIAARLLLDAAGVVGTRHERADHHKREHRDGQRDAAFIGQPSNSHATLLKEDSAHGRIELRNNTWVARASWVWPRAPVPPARTASSVRPRTVTRMR